MERNNTGQGKPFISEATLKEVSRIYDLHDNLNMQVMSTVSGGVIEINRKIKSPEKTQTTTR